MKPIRIIIAGGRDCPVNVTNRVRVGRIIANLNHDDIELVSGTARGADQIPYMFKDQFPIKEFPANWDKFGKSAGYKRNTQMAEYATHLIAFWDGQSKGTKHMIDIAKRLNLKLAIARY